MMPSDHHPTRIGRYRIDGLIGEGGMGRVYRAWDDRLNRQVAIKLVHPGAHEEARGRRLEREAESAAQLSHPSIVRVHDLVSWQGKSAIVMEWIDGASLASHLESGPFDVAVAVGIIRQLAAGLESAHRAGVVHRDLKAANVVLTTEGEAKILDFGLAQFRRSESASRLTQEGRILGTLDSMAPEQWRGGDVGPHTDLFALGVLAYRLLTGRRPFVGETDQELCAQVLTANPRPVCVLREEVPKDVSSLVARLLAKEPGSRPKTAADVVAQLASTESEVRFGSSVSLVSVDNRGGIADVATRDHVSVPVAASVPARGPTPESLVAERRPDSASPPGLVDRRRRYAMMAALILSGLLVLAWRFDVGGIIGRPFEASDLALRPSDPAAASAFDDGVDALRRGDAAEARRQLRRALSVEPDHAYSSAMLAVAASRSGNGAEVSDAASRALAMSTEAPELERLHIRAATHRALREWQLAYDVLNRLSALHPEDLEIDFARVESALDARPVAEVHALIEHLAARATTDLDRIRVRIASVRNLNRGDDYQGALEQAREVQNHARGVEGFEALMARALVEEAKALQGIGTYDASHVVLNDALARYTRLDHRQGRAQAFEVKAFVSYAQSELLLAREMYERSRIAYRDLGNLSGESRATYLLVNILYLEGRVSDAIRELEPMIAKVRTFGGDRLLAAMENTLGTCFQATARLRAAESRYALAAADFTIAGDLANEAIARNNRGEILFELGMLGEAREEHRKARARAEEAGSNPDVVWSKLRSAQVRFAEGDLVVARDGFEDAERGFAAVDEPTNQALAWIQLARLDRLGGAPEAAENHARRAEEILRTGGDAAWAAIAQMFVAEALFDQGDEHVDEVRQLANDALVRIRDIEHFRARISVVARHAYLMHRIDGVDLAETRETLRGLVVEAIEAEFVVLAAEVELTLGLLDIEAGQPGAADRLRRFATRTEEQGLGFWSDRARAVLRERVASLER